ncbi:DUF805 domain-containing protein [Tateyamaria pelophila]|uniref:DUF805 domain-containing protein n=1 Tax=Tateyamaria pelophila TaxID=328415 RepID=UPI001CBB2B4E|nr:DUF805 domain-containing protein [Tateyamaria pelophila]
MEASAHIAAGFRNYARFSGRTARPDYWVFAGFLFVAQILSFFIAPIVAAGFALATVTPGLSAAVRRLHDAGRSGWWLVLPAVVLPGWLLIWFASAAAAMAVRVDTLDNDIYFLTASAIMLVVVTITLFWLAAPSEPGANAHGPNPNEVAG